ncbi:MAG: Gfo/Idh/MocA family oxidoreductase [Chloroflexi bacterium]|nr:Gfo/Idh/MocA family oxidoreductase [Chloroflexota bacterium]
MSDTANSVVSVGIAGLGRAGWGIHVPTLEAMKEKYRVVAVYDPNQDRQADARARLGCRTYPEFTGMLADDGVELIVLATPSHLHAGMAIEALRAGKHVIVEKPFAANLDSADRMIQAARDTGKILTGSQNYRYVADFLKIREVIATGVLGRIVQIRINWHWFRRRWDWQTLKEFGGGSLNNDGSHALDQALLLMGDAEPTVFCHMESTSLSAGDADDHVKVVLKAPGAPVIDMEFSNAVAYPQEMWLVMGTQGGLAGSHTELRWKYFDPSAVPPRVVSREPTPDRSYNREQLPWVEEKCELKEGHRESNHRLYGDLYATLREGAPLAVTAESIRRQIAVLERCRELSPV